MEGKIISGYEAVMYYGKMIDPDFNLDDPQRAAMYERLFNYFKQEPTSEIPLQRGILMNGTVGIGKSEVFRVMNLVFKGTPSAFVFTHAKLTIEKLFKEERDNGEIAVLQKYGYDLKQNLLIDDLGTDEPEYTLYKNPVRLLGTLLLERSELFTTHGFKTHIISNLKTNDMLDRYKERVYDRLRGMTKTINWEGKSLRAGSRR